MKFKSITEIPQEGDYWQKKRIILKYVDEEQIELFLQVLEAIAEENGIKVEDGELDYIMGADY